MNKTIGNLLIIYGFLLPGLGYRVHFLAPAVSRPTLILGLAGGALSLVWGVLAVAGSQRKAMPILTLIPVSFMLLPQTFAAWSRVSEGVQGAREVAVLITLLLVLSLMMLVRIAWSGVVFDVKPASPTKWEGRT
jgi:hypothetical protein